MSVAVFPFEIVTGVLVILSLTQALARPDPAQLLRSGKIRSVQDGMAADSWASFSDGILELSWKAL